MKYSHANARKYPIITAHDHAHIYIYTHNIYITQSFRATISFRKLEILFTSMNERSAATSFETIDKRARLKNSLPAYVTHLSTNDKPETSVSFKFDEICDSETCREAVVVGVVHEIVVNRSSDLPVTSASSRRYIFFL